jgi:hypothetical protein
MLSSMTRLSSLDESPRYQALYEGKNVAAGAETAVSIANGDWTTVSAVRVASLRQSRK